MMFIDWLTVSQEHSHDLPVVCDVFTLTIDANTNEVLSTRQPRFKHEASYSTSVTIHVQGRKIRVEGNPSREIGRASCRERGETAGDAVTLKEEGQTSTNGGAQ